MAEPTKPDKGLPAYTSNWIGLVGVTLTICALIALLILIAFDLIWGFNRPYLGVLIYMVLPGMVFFGLFLIGAGAWYQRRQQRKPGAPAGLPHVDLNNPRHRRNLIIIVCCGFVFLLFSAFGTYRAYQVTESVAFCGLLCHQVMEPVYTTYQDSPHARVACVECHIGPGAEWFVRAKISGLRQVYAVLANSYPRPIQVPVENLRPARETCEHCHWPEKFTGSLELQRRHYLPDADNTPFAITMMIKVGGANPQHGPVGGIHWHMAVANDIEYIPADKTRQDIPWVRITNRQTGRVATYQSQSNPPSPEQLAGPIRKMDCVDCHNRPTHIFHSPNDALNISLWLDRMDSSIPSIKLNASQALAENAEAETKIQGLRRISELLSGKYSGHEDQAKIRQAITETQNIYRNNFFPEMKTSWQVRPNNSSHFIWPGCFRCHDGDHVTPTGEPISRDCNACHTIISQAMGNEAPTTNLEGLPFAHPGGEVPGDMACNFCHSGAH